MITNGNSPHNGSHSQQEPLKAVLVGCGGMGRNQARIISRHPDFTLSAVCDMDAVRTQAVADEFGAKAYTNFAEMLESEQPDVVAIPTSNKAHGPLTIQAAEFGVRGIYCEKPMAMNMVEARRMVDLCREKGTVLVINHQRRLGADLVEAKRIVDSGALGDILLVRGEAAGDMLSDGTHCVDSLMFVLGDPTLKNIVGHLVRDVDALRQKWSKLHRDEPEEGFGFRYGHAVESAAMAVAELSNGVRMELFTGELRENGRIYQDYTIHGTRGTLWRLGDKFGTQNLYISDANGGDCVQKIVEGYLSPVPAPDGKGNWRQVHLDVPEHRVNGIVTGFDMFADSVRTGAEHPMSGEIALRGFEIVMGVYASARFNRRLDAPIEADEFPLDAMLKSPAAPAVS